MEKQYAGSQLTGLSSLQGGGAIGISVPKQPPVGRLFNALDMMRKASVLAGETADCLCGAQPTGEGSAKQEIGSGTFSEIEIAADQFQRMAEQIISDMGRIQSRL